MTLIRVDQSSTAVWEPVTLKGRVTGVPREIVFRQVRGETIRALPSLYPHDRLRKELVWAAKRFAADIEKQGYERLTAEADFVVWGPYRSRAGTYTDTMAVTAYREDENHNEDLCDFVIEAQFLRRRHRPVETRGGARGEAAG